MPFQPIVAMGPLSWVVAFLVIFASILVARWKPRYKVQDWDLQARKVNDSLYELQKPMGDPIMQILFFHGVPFEDILTVHLSTWESEDRSCLWPKTWLGEDFPHAHILAVSYNEGLQNRSGGSFGMYNIGENLISDLLQADIGQTPHCPVVLVGHSFGGLVIKKLCMQAQNMRMSKIDGLKAKKFLDHVMGIFYYSTPHGGSPHINRAANVLDGHLIEYFRVLNTEAQQLNHDFNRLCASYPWLIGGLGESLPVKSGLFRGVIVVPEASSRGGDNFTLETADHFSICKPENKTSRRFNALTKVLHNIAEHLKEEIRKRDARALEEARPQNFQRLPEHMEGLDLLLEQVIEKLKKSKILGLAGMGGVGKTTLAKATFNELGSTFEYTCFVRDVKLIVANERELKEAVWKDMHCNSQKVGGEAEWSKLAGKKLLLIFDDISGSRDVEVLLDIAHDSSAESRFIVTSRDRELLNNLGDVYPIPFLAEDHSEKLFLSHAFPNQAIPLPKLANLVKEIVKKCEGLPLTLEVLGKYLNSTEDDEDWKQTLHALDKAEALQTFDERLWAKLMLSYDGLDKTAQQMFLDAATFFSDGYLWTLGEAMIAWSAAYETKIERLLWKSLVDRSLVYSVKEDEYIQVHEQMRSVGRKIASESNDNGPCRVWEETEALRLLRTTDEVDNKEFHSLLLPGRSWYELHKDYEDEDEDEDEDDDDDYDDDNSDEDDGAIHIAGCALQKLKKLKFLHLGREVVIDGWMEVEAVPSNLVLLKCVGVRILNLALQGRLAVLHLHLGEDLLPSSIGQLSALRKLVLSAMRQSALPHEIGHLAKLETFLMNVSDLKSLPESFGNLSALNHLEFSFCNVLRALPESFGNLSTLKHLEFEECDALQALPESFGNLSTLRHLVFEGCGALQALPESFGNLSALEHLGFESCSPLQALPESFGNLLALQHLEFNNCFELQALPESFGNLSALQHLEFNNCFELQAFPESFGNLSALMHLVFNSCNAMQALPESFGNLCALEHLELDSCSRLQALPESFGNLSALEHLELDHCSRLQALPESFGNLSALNHLEFQYCDELQALPESFGNLSALEHLGSSCIYELQALPESFGNLSALNHLEFQNCEQLQALPESFGNLSALEHLGFNCLELQALPESFGNLSALKHLEFKYCDELHALPESFGNLSALKHLEFHQCKTLKALPESFGNLSALEHLEFVDCPALQDPPGSFGNLSAL